MYRLLTNKGQLFAIILGVLVVVIFLGSVFSGLSNAGYTMGDDLNAIMKTTDQTFDFFDLGLQLTLVLIVIGLLSAVLFGLYQLISAPKQSIKGIIGMAVIAILFFALYSTAGTDVDSVIGDVIAKFGVTDNTSKLISGGIMTTLILLGLSLASMLLFEVYNLFK